MQTLKSQSRPESAPFVKWAGGKTQLLAKLDAQIPHFTRYFEPFLGGGALFFHLSSSRSQFSAQLSDANRELVNSYNVVKHHVEQLIDVLERQDRKSTRLNSSHVAISYAVF